MVIGYILLTVCYYANIFNGRNIQFMSTSLFGLDGNTYNQSAVIDPDFKLNSPALEVVGLPRYTTTYAISQLAYNLSLGAAVTSIGLWHWKELRNGGLKMTRMNSYLTFIWPAFVDINWAIFFKRGENANIDDPHYNGKYIYLSSHCGELINSQRCENMARIVIAFTIYAHKS